MKKRLRILAAGDIHGSNFLAEQLAKKAEKYKVDLVILTGDLSSPFKKEAIITPFKKRNLETLFVPGNWDTELDVNFLKKEYGLKNLEGYYIRRGEFDIIGIGNKDFKLKHTKEDFENLKKLFEKIKKRKTKKIFVSHLHPKDTLAEFSGFIGDKVLKEIIESMKPHVAISSHIHEAEGLEGKIGKTKIFHVGPRGKIIDL